MLRPIFKNRPGSRTLRYIFYLQESLS